MADSTSSSDWSNYWDSTWEDYYNGAWGDYSPTYESNLYGLDPTSYESYIGSAYDQDIYDYLKSSLTSSTSSGSEAMGELSRYIDSGESLTNYVSGYEPETIEAQTVGVDGGYQSNLTSQYLNSVLGAYGAARQGLGDTYGQNQYAYQNALKNILTEEALAKSGATSQAATDAATLQLEADTTNASNALSADTANQAANLEYANLLSSLGAQDQSNQLAATELLGQLEQGQTSSDLTQTELLLNMLLGV